MNILHIASITENQASGVDVVVPVHVLKQAETEDVHFYNLNDVPIKALAEYQMQSVSLNRFVEQVISQIGKPDLVILHEAYLFAFTKIYRALVKADIPYILVPHGELTRQAQKKKRFKKHIANLLFFNRLFSKSLALQCLSTHELAESPAKYKKFIGTNGVFDQPDKKQTFRDHGCELIYIGRLEMCTKGLARLVDALAIIKEFCITQQVTVCLYGPDINNRRAELQSYIDEAGVQEFVTIHDPVFGQKKTEVTKNADLFVQASHSEGMPIGILEAMNIGVPCLLTKGTCLVPDLTAYDAGYALGETPAEIAATIKTAVLDRAHWKAKGQGGIKMTSEKYSWDVVTRDNLAMYQTLLAQRK